MQQEFVEFRKRSVEEMDVLSRRTQDLGERWIMNEPLIKAKRRISLMIHSPHRKPCRVSLPSPTLKRLASTI